MGKCSPAYIPGGNRMPQYESRLAANLKKGVLGKKERKAIPPQVKPPVSQSRRVKQL
jgi:hypothetical protein